MEFLSALLTLILFVTFVSSIIFFVGISAHSASFDCWKYNFSKKGLMKRMKKVICLTLISAAIYAILSKLRNWFNDTD